MNILKKFLLVFFIPLIGIAAIVGIVYGAYVLAGDNGAFIAVLALFWAAISLRIALDSEQ
jgi:hypothetical protein